MKRRYVYSLESLFSAQFWPWSPLTCRPAEHWVIMLPFNGESGILVVFARLPAAGRLLMSVKIWPCCCSWQETSLPVRLLCEFNFNHMLTGGFFLLLCLLKAKLKIRKGAIGFFNGNSPLVHSVFLIPLLCLLRLLIAGLLHREGSQRYFSPLSYDFLGSYNKATALDSRLMKCQTL